MPNINKQYQNLASKGRYGDTMLAHINPQEAGLLKSMGGSGTINPRTGLPEFFESGVGRNAYSMPPPTAAMLPVLEQTFGTDEFKDIADKLPTTTVEAVYRGGMGGFTPASEKINAEYDKYANKDFSQARSGNVKITGYTVPTDKTFQDKPLVAQYDATGNFIHLTIEPQNALSPDPNQPNIYALPKFNKTGGIVDYGVGDKNNQDDGGFLSSIGQLAKEFGPMIALALGANALAGSGLFTGAGAAAAGGNAGALINAGMGGSAAQAASAAANLAATTAGLDAAVLAGGGLVSPVATNFLSPEIVAGAGGAGGAGGAAAGTGLLSGAPAVTPPPAPPAPPVVPPAASVAAAEGAATAGTGAASSILSSLASATGIPLADLNKLAPSVIQGLIGAGGSYLQSEQAKEAAKTQSDAQIRAAQIAADAARFRPVGVTTRFGSSNFQTDAQGNVIGAGYTPSAEITGYQDRLKVLANQGLTDAEGARAAYQPLTGAAQSLFGLGQNYLNSNLGQPLTDMSRTYMQSQAGQPLTSMGQTYMASQVGQPVTSLGQTYMQSQAGQPLTQLGQQYIASDVGQPLTSLGQQYLQKSPDQIAADYIAKQQALLNPSRQNDLAQLQNRLFQQGRGGAATAQGGNLGATSPELQAYYNALAQSDLQLAANARQAGQQETQFGANLYSTGLGLTSGRQLQGADLYRSGRGLTREEQIAGANLYGQGTGLTQAQQLAGADLYRSGTGLTQSQQLAGADLYRLGTNLTQQGQQFGAGLFGTGADLQNRFYTGQTAAYSPFATAMDTSSGLERLAQQPLDLSTAIGSRVSTANANAGLLTGQGIMNAARTMAPANTYSGTGQALSGVANSPVFNNAVGQLFGQTPEKVRNMYTGELVDAYSVPPTSFRRDPVTGQYIPVG